MTIDSNFGLNVDQFNTMVSASLKRGNTLDKLIPQQTAMAVQWIERNYTFKYMEAFRLVVIQTGERVIEMPPGSFVKTWIFFRIINSDGTYSYINRVEGGDLLQVGSLANRQINGSVAAVQTSVIKPANFFQVGLSNLVLDAVPSQNFNAEAMFYNYSSWPTDATTVPGGGSTFTHPLLAVATDLVLAQTQMFCAVNIIKDMRMIQAYKALRDEAVNTLTRAEDETKFAGENIRMLYNPIYDAEQVASLESGSGIVVPPPSTHPFVLGKSKLGDPGTPLG